MKIISTTLAAMFVASTVTLAAPAFAATPAPERVAITTTVATPLAVQSSAATIVEFRPDYSNALSTVQIVAAWSTELERLFPQLHGDG